MQRTFVKYTPSIEQVEPDFDKNLQVVIETSNTYIRNSVEAEGQNTAVRSAHAKSYGLTRAEVEILDGLPPEYTQGIYAHPGRHEALIRFSNGSPHVGADALLGNTTGMGLKIFGIAGKTLLEDESDSGTFDYALINGPTFFCNTVEHYLFIQQLVPRAGEYLAKGKAGLHQFLHDWVTGMGTLPPEEWAWDELRVLISLQLAKPVNLLLSTYWTMGAVRHGDYVAKVRVAPVKMFADQVEIRNLDLATAPEVYRPALVAELKQRPYEFDIQVQLCVDLEKMPIEDVTVEWPEQLSPFVTVAKVRLPQQDIGGEGNLELADATSMAAWRCHEEHRPLGNIQRTRKEVYRQSSLLRHKLNHQIRREPKNLAEVFGNASV